MLVKNLVQGRLVNGSVGQVIGFSTSSEAIKQHLEVAKSEETVQPNPDLAGSTRRWPVVRFTHGEELVMVPQEFTINNADGGMEASREQVPLILAWALSVHKSQGQTIERVRVDLKQTFEKGQGALTAIYQLWLTIIQRMSPFRAQQQWNSLRFGIFTPPRWLLIPGFCNGMLLPRPSTIVG
ncbi:hypothetical protein C8R47DRAFT_237948 [Mycena vitilis]|nr:hypothetical protein C8R47DRAFT_237948 [Mycena vitilis]